MLFHLFENSVSLIWICDSISSIEFKIISIRISDINRWYYLFEYVIAHIYVVLNCWYRVTRIRDITQLSFLLQKVISYWFE